MTLGMEAELERENRGTPLGAGIRSAERTVIREALVEAREIIREDRDAFYECNVLSNGAMEQADEAIVRKYDAALDRINNALRVL